VGSYRLHLYCAGEGSPTVILEAGAASSSLMWYFVQKDVAGFTRVCSYDRAGFGWSDPASGPLSPEQVAVDLHTLLKAAGVPGFYVLVGHSAGGVYARAYTSQYPSEVVGLVLVDSSHEGQNVRFPREYTELSKTQDYMTGFCQLVSPFGGMRVAKVWNAMTSEFQISADVGEAVLSTMYRTAFCRAMADEMEALSVSLGQPDIPGSLGDLPLIVLTAGITADDMYAQIPEAMRSMVGREVIARVYEATREMQQDLVGLSTQGRQVIAEASGHYIQLDQPDLVIDAIREIVEQVRGG